MIDGKTSGCFNTTTIMNGTNCHLVFFRAFQCRIRFCLPAADDFSQILFVFVKCNKVKSRQTIHSHYINQASYAVCKRRQYNEKEKIH